MRDLKVDTLRAIAIVSILLAHSGVKYFIFNLRSFDVPLMAFCLGISYYYSSKNVSYLRYVKKRIKRLLLPTILFLIILFSVFYMIDFFLNTPYHFDAHYIIHSFYMETSYGYGWIMRTFFLVSLSLPILYKLSEKASQLSSILLIFLGLVVFQCLLIYLEKAIPNDFQYWYDQIIPLSFGYCPIAFLGLVAKKINTKNGMKASLIMLIGLIISFSVLGFSGFNTFKYPPQAPFIFYGCFCAIVLWVIVHLVEFKNICVVNSIKFLSINSQLIYFVHVFFLFIYEFYLEETVPFLNKWELNYVYLLLSTILTVLLLNKVKFYFKKVGSE